MNPWVRRSLEATAVASGLAVMGAGMAHAAEAADQPRSHDPGDRASASGVTHRKAGAHAKEPSGLVGKLGSGRLGSIVAAATQRRSGPDLSTSAATGRQDGPPAGIAGTAAKHVRPMRAVRVPDPADPVPSRGGRTHLVAGRGGAPATGAGPAGLLPGGTLPTGALPGVLPGVLPDGASTGQLGGALGGGLAPAANGPSHSGMSGLLGGRDGLAGHRSPGADEVTAILPRVVSGAVDEYTVDDAVSGVLDSAADLAAGRTAPAAGTRTASGGTQGDAHDGAVPYPLPTPLGPPTFPAGPFGPTGPFGQLGQGPVPGLGADGLPAAVAGAGEARTPQPMPLPTPLGPPTYPAYPVPAVPGLGELIGAFGSLDVPSAAQTVPGAQDGHREVQWGRESAPSGPLPDLGELAGLASLPNIGDMSDITDVTHGLGGFADLGLQDR